MKILVSGSSGLVGSALVPVLIGRGHDVSRLVRSAEQVGEGAIFWDPLAGTVDQASIEGFDAVVHLAGENIAAGRWSPERKALIRDSRVKGTQLISETLSRLKSPPSVFISASAIGYYGDRGEQLLVEESPAGGGFLAEVTQSWEAATQPAAEKGIRVVILRTGVVLSSKGGALARMLPPFEMGLGGPLGSGRQYMSWISLADLVGVIELALGDERLSGAVNAVAPNPVTNKQFATTLGAVLGRPAIFPVPAVAMRLLFGEMADEVMLSSQRLEPRKLVAVGYRFQHRDLETALRHVLGKQ